jgi:deazaflavin-dependent oxidoreductase (nitroreductase family)
MAQAPGKWTRTIYRLLKKPPQLIYALGLGPILGKRVFLLTTIGRKSGLKRVTPLQYEEIEGVIYTASAHGTHADWVRNIIANPAVEVRVGARHFQGQAEVITDPGRIADFIAYRLERHPRMIGAMLRAEGLPVPPTRDQLETFAAEKALVTIHPAQAE